MGYIEDFKQMEEVSVENLLEKEKIVVPEIQREYVWGNNKPVLVRFINDINENYNKKMDMNVGFLYSYKPNNSEVYLIDGQQRFTTLILLAFYCSIKDNCISDFRSLLKIKESAPSFSYRVRSYTELFMSSLFKDIDSLDDLNPEKIKCKKWYLSVYKKDISIESMLNTLDIIYKHKPSITYGYITSKIKFWYFNVINTSEGEELYITMNSRGESLKPYENIKPMLINECISDEDKKSYGKLWNDWEEFFYQKKGTRDINSVDTAMDNLILVIFELKNKKEYGNNNLEGINKKILLKDIESYFGILEQLYKTKDYCDEVDRLFGDKDDDKDFLLLKALLVAKDEDRNKMYHIISNCIRRSIVNNIPLLKFLNDYKNQPELLYKFILDTKNNNKEKLHDVFDPHELQKIRMMYDTNSDQLEKIIWEAQSDTVLNGCLCCLWPERFKEPIYNENQKLSEDEINLLEKRFKVFKDVFSTYNISHPLFEMPPNCIDNSIISRTLLAINHEYKGINIRFEQYDFGYKDSWTKIVNEKSYIETISKMLNYIAESKNSAYDTMQKIIEERLKNYSDGRDSRYYILRYPESLQAMYSGYNILGFDGDWNNYWINVLDEKSYHGYFINMFKLLVYHQLKSMPETKEWVGNDFWLVDKHTHLYIDCKKTHGWIIVWKKGEDDNFHPNINHLLQYFDAYHPQYIENENFISLNDTSIDKDLIEEGCKLTLLIHNYVLPKSLKTFEDS